MKNTLQTLAVLLVLLLVGTVISRITSSAGSDDVMNGDTLSGEVAGVATDVVSEKTPEELLLEQLKPYFDAEEINAESVYVYAEHLGMAMYERDAHVERPIASLTKMMTAITALEEFAAEGPEITLSKSAISQAGDYGLRVDEVWRARDLVKFMLITSCNDCAEALSEGLSHLRNERDETQHASVNSFLKQMNTLADMIGIQHTYFTNVTGFDEGEVSGPYGSAADMAHLALYGLDHYPDVFRASVLDGVSFQSIDGKEHEAKNTNTVLDELPGLVMQKTGYTTIAGGNLVFITEPHAGERYAVVIMGSGFNERFDDAITLTNIIEFVRTLIAT